MAIKIIGTIIGGMILAAGLYYLVKEREDEQSRRIYTVVSIVGGVMFAGMLLLTLLAR